MSWQHKAELGDPLYIVARKQEREIKRDTRIIEERMGRKLTSVSERIQRDMYQWGAWAKRPQFWTNLGVTPFARLMGMIPPGEPKDIRLDPQNMAIHRAVMGLDDKYKVVLYAYYVAELRHEDREQLFNSRGISRATYYRRLDAGSVMAHNRAMRALDHAATPL